MFQVIYSVAWWGAVTNIVSEPKRHLQKVMLCRL